MTYYEIPLKQQPAQKFSFIKGDYEYLIRLKTMGKSLYMDLTVNNKIVFQGLRCDAGINMSEGFEYLEFPGAFYFTTESNNPPYWERLGVQDKLIFGIEE